jgi:glucokinase
MTNHAAENGHRAVGVDLGGTKIEVALVDSQGTVKKRVREPTEAEKGYTAVKEHIITMVRQVLEETGGRPCGVGVGIAGQVELKTGVVLFAPNLHWENTPLQSDLSDALSVSVAVTNDVRAACWGEWLFGAGKGTEDMVALFVGTGIGGSAVVGGRMLSGCSNTLGEIGHMPVDLNGPKCHCGSWGCVEAIAGGWAIARQVREALDSNPREGEALLRLASGRREAITAGMVVQALKEGDPLSKKIMDRVTEALVAASIGIVNAFNPCRLILGGGVIEGYPKLIELIREGVRKRALKAAAERLEVLKASLGGDAGVVGAAALALCSFTNIQPSGASKV